MNTYSEHVYSPYGYTAAFHLTGPVLGFNGEFATHTGSFYLLGSGYRAYDTGLMRFISPDNLSPFGDGGINMYAYCSGDPVNRIDPTGHSFRHPKNRSLSAQTPLIKLPRRGRELQVHAQATNLGTKHFPEADLDDFSYVQNQYLLRISKHELTHAKAALLNTPIENSAAASRRYVLLENRHHELVEGFNKKINQRYASVIEALTQENAYRPKAQVRFNPELMSLMSAGMDLLIPSAYNVRSVRPPY